MIFVFNFVTMDTLQACLAKVQRRGMEWECVSSIVRNMQETVTFHDGQVMSKKDLCLLFCPRQFGAMLYLTDILAKNETCEISGVVYSATSLLVHLIDTGRLDFDANACERLVKIITKNHTDLFLIPIKGRIYSCKDIILHGLDIAHQIKISDHAVPFLMMRLSMLMHESEKVSLNGGVPHTRTDLLLSVLNYPNYALNDDVAEQARQLLLQFLPPNARLEKSDKYIITTSLHT